MPEQNSAKRFWLDQQETLADVTDSPGDDTQQPPQSQSTQLTESAATSMDSAGHSETQAAADSGDIEQIHHLEQTLAQSRETLRELSSQLREQQQLETQLAKKAEVVSTHQQDLEVQIAQAQIREQTFQESLINVEALIQAQQAELGRLKAQLSQQRTTLKNGQKQLERQLTQQQTILEAEQQRVRSLESQILSTRNLAGRLEVQLAAAYQEIEVLYERLSDRAYSLKQLEAQLDQTEAVVSEQNTTIASLTDQIAALESQLAEQAELQAQLEQASEEQVADSDDLTSSSELENQDAIADVEPHRETLPEQNRIQAQQVSEYEVAIQYWKERCESTQRHAQQLQEVLERSLPGVSTNLSELLMTLQPSVDTQISEPITTESQLPESSSKPIHVDLPIFVRKVVTEGQGSRGVEE